MIEYIDPRTIYKDAPKEALTDKERLVLRQLASRTQSRKRKESCGSIIIIWKGSGR